MQIIPLQPIPNQTLTTSLDGSVYVITVIAARGSMAVTVVRDNITLVQNARAVANAPILPSRYQEQGNFLFNTAGFLNIPDYTQFGNTQFLAFFQQTELAEFRSPRLVFSPLGDLPLRYAPKGYKLAS